MGRESQIARFPESRAWNRQKFRSKKQKNESDSTKNRNRRSPRFFVANVPVAGQTAVDGWMDGWRAREGKKKRETQRDRLRERESAREKNTIYSPFSSVTPS